MNQMDRIVIKYQEAEEEFARMDQAAVEMYEQSEQMREMTQNALNAWKGSDASAFAESINRYVAKLTQQADGLRQFVSTLRAQAEQNYYKEMADAKAVESM